MSEYFLLPLTYTEFLDWYNRRIKQFQGLRFIPASLSGDSNGVHVEGGWQKVLIESIPEYDEDFQVMMALVAVEKPRKYREIDVNGKTKRVPNLEEVDISKLETLYPLTERGARMLRSRLDSRIRVGDPVFEEDVREQDRRRNRQQAEAGGNALLELLDLHGISEAAINNVRDEVLHSVHVKLYGAESVEASSMLSAVIFYERHDKPDFPSTSIGSVYDYFALVNDRLRQVCNESLYKEAIDEILRPARNILDQVGRSRSAPELLYELDPYFQDLDERTDLDLDRCRPETAIMFLDLRDQIRRAGSLDETNLEGWTQALRANDRELDYAMALWMVGAFFDFSQFADEYYAAVKSSFMQ